MKIIKFVFLKETVSDSNQRLQMAIAVTIVVVKEIAFKNKGAGVRYLRPPPLVVTAGLSALLSCKPSITICELLDILIDIAFPALLMCACRSFCALTVIGCEAVPCLRLMMSRPLLDAL